MRAHKESAEQFSHWSMAARDTDVELHTPFETNDNLGNLENVKLKLIKNKTVPICFYSSLYLTTYDLVLIHLVEFFFVFLF